MIRLYNSIPKDKIFGLHKILRHLIFDIWCKANNIEWKEKTNNKKLKKLLHYSVKKDVTFEEEIERIYNIFRTLSPEENQKIKKAWKINNNIQKLCDKTILPIYLKDLPPVIKKDIKPLFEWCYEYLINQKEVSGDKLKYYNKLISLNKFKTCPCCGLIPIESTENNYREDYDHFIPKSIFPFASVNFKNLVPACNKCNSKRKSSKNPIINTKKAFYPFTDSSYDHDISINFKINNMKKLDSLERKDLEIIFVLKNKNSELQTWNWLFDIEERYNDTVRGFTKTFLRDIKSIHRMIEKKDKKAKYKETIDDLIDMYIEDKFEENRFLKIPLLEIIKKRKDIVDIFNN